MREPVKLRSDGPIATITLDRPEVRNAIDRPTAVALAAALRRFDADASLSVAVVTGAGGMFCAGADLGAVLDPERAPRVAEAGDAPLGFSRLLLSKPCIAAVEGFAVAGGLELAVWCDLRVAARDAVLGVFCRRWGVPLVDGGTVRLARLVGQGRALDLILTGRGVPADEALAMGLVDRVVEKGEALPAALELARSLAALPQACLRSDRLSTYEQWSLPWEGALRNELRRGQAVLASGEAAEGAARFLAQRRSSPNSR
jgi:enoyl-CoA hydratase